MPDYYFEMAKTEGGNLTDDEKEELLRSVAEEAGLDNDEWEIGPPVIRRELGTPDQLTIIGSIALPAATLLVELYRVVKNREDLVVRSMNESGGQMIFGGDYDEAIVAEHGATVIGIVEGDVIYKDDADDRRDLIVAMSEDREEHDNKEES